MAARHTVLGALVLFAGVAWPGTSDAYVYWGNPKLKVDLVRAEADLDSGAADLYGVRVHQCGGGYDDYVVEDDVDPVAGFELTIDGGDLCGVELRWDSDVTATSTGAFVLRYEQVVTAITFDATGSGEADFDPFTVDQGTHTGSTPTFVAWLE
jgi:hypothetical protein